MNIFYGPPIPESERDIVDDPMEPMDPLDPPPCDPLARKRPLCTSTNGAKILRLLVIYVTYWCQLSDTLVLIKSSMEFCRIAENLVIIRYEMV